VASSTSNSQYLPVSFGSDNKEQTCSQSLIIFLTFMGFVFLGSRNSILNSKWLVYFKLCEIWDSHGVQYDWDIAPCSFTGVDRRFRRAPDDGRRM
jgi:hypothetical protein